MAAIEQLSKVAINAKSHTLLHQILNENPKLHHIIRKSNSGSDMLAQMKAWALCYLEKNPSAVQFYKKVFVGKLDHFTLADRLIEIISYFLTELG